MDIKNIRTKAGRFVKRCPKSGRITGFIFDTKISKIWMPVAGLSAIIWFLVRVIPKPSRATYPCQQVAAGMGIGFLSYLAIIIGSYPVFKTIRKVSNLSQTKIIILTGIILISTTIGISVGSIKIFQQNLSHQEGANTPMGEAVGIFRGRVVWAQNFNATSWIEKNGFWWDDIYTNQQEVDKMFSNSIKSLAGAKTDSEAWKKLFVFHNKTNGRGNNGYKLGEKIVIKINCNATTDPDTKWTDKGYSSPQIIFSLVKQLIEVAGVDGSNQSGAIKRWSTMENDWFSSLLMSQDSVALESVVFDFISSEPNLTNGNPSFNGNQENGLHESALANNPPSAARYDPENDGTTLQSLGVHEHWNNNSDKKYSRNLGIGKGIELIAIKSEKN